MSSCASALPRMVRLSGGFGFWSFRSRRASTDSKMRMNPVQRQRLPASPSRISAIAGCGLCSSKLRRGHQHARRADAALRAAAVEKRLLQRMQLAIRWPVLRRSESRRLRPATPEPGNCSPARHSCAPSTSRTRLRRSLPWFRSDADLRAAHRAGASWAEHAPCGVSPFTVNRIVGQRCAHSAAGSSTGLARGEPCEKIFRQQRNRVEADAGRIANGVQNCGRGAVMRQFADALGAERRRS